MAILEIPGQIFNYVDVWFRNANGRIEHYYAGDRYPYVERTVKHASAAFPIPKELVFPVEVLIRAKNDTSHPMNFAAWVWPETQWQDYLLKKRAWYGAFIGAILVLCFYNLFLAFMLRDISYLFYVGYVLCITFSVILLSGLAEEYLWPAGKPAPMVLAAAGLGTFLAVAFVNQFLAIRSRLPRLYWSSTAISGFALVCGMILVFNRRLPLVPAEYGASVVHLLMLVSAVYFVAISMVSYFTGVTQARFLALSMVALLSCMLIYFSYTYGLLAYNPVIGHALEFGVLAEGVLLSLALADRITILTRDKQVAEEAAMIAQKSFSRQLITSQEKQRQDISEALHDSIGHAVLVLKNALLERERYLTQEYSIVKDGAPEFLEEQIDQCGEILTDVRRLSHDLHPHILQRLGLAAALESTFERALEPAGIEWRLDIDELPGDMASDLEITVYRVVQEALNNILKYARATRVECRLHTASDTIHCSVSDNGVGFVPSSTGAATLGLQESAARIQLLSGSFRVESGPGNGTSVRFDLPLVAAANGKALSGQEA